MIERGIHDEANIFPFMNDAEFEALKEDIKANGLREPIVVHEGKILDGRNRLRACQEVGVEPKFKEWDQKGTPFDFVIGANMVRRHLNSSQRALVAYEIVKRKAVSARGCMLSGLSIEEVAEGVPGDGESGKSKNKHDREAAEMAAKLCGTNRQYVADIKKIAEEAPEKLDEIKSGRKTISQIKRELKKTDGKKDPRDDEKTKTKSAESSTFVPDAEDWLSPEGSPLKTLDSYISRLTFSRSNHLISDEEAEKLCDVLKNHVESFNKLIMEFFKRKSKNMEDFDGRKAEDHAPGRGPGSGDAGKPDHLAGGIAAPDTRRDSGSGGGGAPAIGGSESSGRS